MFKKFVSRPVFVEAYIYTGMIEDEAQLIQWLTLKGCVNIQKTIFWKSPLEPIMTLSFEYPKETNLRLQRQFALQPGMVLCVYQDGSMRTFVEEEFKKQFHPPRV